MCSTIHLIQSSRSDVSFPMHTFVDVLQINEIHENVFENLHNFMSSGLVWTILDS